VLHFTSRRSLVSFVKAPLTGSGTPDMDVRYSSSPEFATMSWHQDSASVGVVVVEESVDSSKEASDSVVDSSTGTTAETCGVQPTSTTIAMLSPTIVLAIRIIDIVLRVEWLERSMVHGERRQRTFSATWVRLRSM
jgi:hypothetical protein